MNAMANLIVRWEKELEMKREGQTLPAHHDFVAIRSKPNTPNTKKTEQKVAPHPVRKSAPCACPASSD